jgi:hypothetical protein
MGAEAAYPPWEQTCAGESADGDRWEGEINEVSAGNVMPQKRIRSAGCCTIDRIDRSKRNRRAAYFCQGQTKRLSL